MNEETLQLIASQLRNPEGEQGKQAMAKMNTGNAIINRHAIAAMDIQANDIVLEIGMGNAFFAKEIVEAAENVEYYGCDSSETMVDEAFKINAELIEEEVASFFLAEAEDLPFEPETFDKVFSVNTIYFWEDPKVELAEIHRVLKPGGKLVIAIRPESTMKHYPFVKYGFTLYGKAGLSKVLKAAGFNVLAADEHEEPDQEIVDVTVKVSCLIVSAEKA